MHFILILYQISTVFFKRQLTKCIDDDNYQANYLTMKNIFSEYI